jgi:hypothetical protein
LCIAPWRKFSVGKIDNEDRVFTKLAIAVQMMEPCTGVRLQATPQVLQLLPRMLASAIL